MHAYSVQRRYTSSQSGRLRLQAARAARRNGWSPAARVGSFERLIGWAAVTDDWGDLLPHWQATLEKLASEPEAASRRASKSIA